MSPPSSGYNDIVFAQEPPLNDSSARGIGATMSRTRLIGGDLNGSVRMWDPKLSNRPLWSMSTGTHPVNALALSANQQYLVCGTELGYLVVSDSSVSWTLM